MGRLDLSDKPVDFVSVTKEYLSELYDKIEAQKAHATALELRLERSETELAACRQRLHAAALVIAGRTPRRPSPDDD